MKPVDLQSIERFVRSTLGCKCPDKVFASIVIEHARLPDTGLAFTRLVIGNRLLIHILEASTIKVTAATVSNLAKQGLAERDAKQYHRFRLVILSAHPSQQMDDARTSFASAIGLDDRAHLHVLDTDQLPDALR